MSLERFTISLVDHAAKWVERIVSFAFFCVVILELINLVLRIFGKGIPQEGDIGALTVFLVCFLGIANGFAKGAHVRFTWGLEKMPTSLALLLGRVGWLLSLLTLGILCWYGLDVTIRFFSMYLPTVSMPWFPTWLPMAAMPFGSALSILAVLVYLRRKSTAAVDPPEASADL